MLPHHVERDDVDDDDDDDLFRTIWSRTRLRPHPTKVENWVDAGMFR